ncbi:DUF4352 domain-containing protein [Melittangium boletus]|uniref:Lipoprotein n=1 Tax=Melittangium boletus DSM 14713 TaxID=1294270 RepID=A0A250I8D1_9BACT|nr:DUF4352 domain-containing protein [Melittangium boletus]ATB28015.1 lipoprotein [Melittangium boletus DSM 14713]
MSVHSRVLAALLCASAWLGGCKDQPEPEPTTDRTLEQLRLEVERVNKGGAPAAPPDAPVDPNERLAQLAAAQDADAPKRLSLVSREAVRVNDGFEVRPAGLEAMHTLRGTGKLSLTTDEYFVRLTLETRNRGQEPASLSLSNARLVDEAGKEYAIARDAQNVGGTRQLDLTQAESDQGQSLVLVFEVPESALAPGLELLVPTRGGPDARIPLR